MKRIFAAASVLTMMSTNSAAARNYQFSCLFTYAYDAAGKRHAENMVWDFSLDTDARKAIATSNNGSTPVAFRAGEEAVSFMEILDSGAVHTTTILLSDGTAVHSRHSIYLGQTNFHQLHGRCTVR